MSDLMQKQEVRFMIGLFLAVVIFALWCIFWPATCRAESVKCDTKKTLEQPLVDVSPSPNDTAWVCDSGWVALDSGSRHWCYKDHGGTTEIKRAIPLVGKVKWLNLSPAHQPDPLDSLRSEVARLTKRLDSLVGALTPDKDTTGPLRIPKAGSPMIPRGSEEKDG